MTSKERIKRVLNFQKTDRIGIYDVFLDQTVEEWRADGLPKETNPGDYFGHDFQIIPLDKFDVHNVDKNKYVSISIDEPFTQVSKELGPEEALKKMAHETNYLRKLLRDATDGILKKSELVVEKFHDAIDGLWLYGHIAYQRGLYFSLDSYKSILLPLHKELCTFFRSRGLDIIFHSDGDIRQILPIFVDLGIRAVEPLEADSGLDVIDLRKEFRKDLALFGNMEFTKLKFSKEAFREEVASKLEFLKKEGGYIYRMDKDVTPDIKFNDYMGAMEIVRTYGDYDVN